MARARGRNLHVVKSEGNTSGLFFVTGEGGLAWSSWESLGWTVEEAKAEIEHKCSPRYNDRMLSESR